MLGYGAGACFYRSCRTMARTAHHCRNVHTGGRDTERNQTLTLFRRGDDFSFVPWPRQSQHSIPL